MMIPFLQGVGLDSSHQAKGAVVVSGWCEHHILVDKIMGWWIMAPSIYVYRSNHRTTMIVREILQKTFLVAWWLLPRSQQVTHQHNQGEDYFSRIKVFLPHRHDPHSVFIWKKRGVVLASMR